MEQFEQLKTVGEVARHLRVDETTVRRWVKNGAMQAVFLPHKGTRQGYRIKLSEVQKFDPAYKG